MRILNEVVRVTEAGVELEADPRHAELVIKKLGLEGAKVSTVPGAKEPGGKKEHRTENVDSIKEAKSSAGNRQWHDEDDAESKKSSKGVVEDQDDPLLDAAEARIY